MMLSNFITNVQIVRHIPQLQQARISMLRQKFDVLHLSCVQVSMFNTVCCPWFAVMIGKYL